MSPVGRCLKSGRDSRCSYCRKGVKSVILNIEDLSDRTVELPVVQHLSAKFSPAIHQAVAVGKWFYEIRKVKIDGRKTFRHIAHDGITNEKNAWLVREGGELIPKYDKPKTIGTTKWSAYAIHYFSKKIEKIVKRRDLALWGNDNYYDFFYRNCQHFVASLLSAIMETEISTKTRSDRFLEFLPSSWQRKLISGYNWLKISGTEEPPPPICTFCDREREEERE